MAQGSTAQVLRRKADQARAAADAPAGPAGPGKAFCDAIRRAAEQELSLAVVPGEPQQRRASPDEIVEGLPEHVFLGLLIGPEDGAGLIALDAAALAAVIEMRTMGRVSSRPPLARRPTPTDAAMVADLVDRILAEFETPLMPTEDARWAAGWRYQMFLSEARPLPVVLEEVQHRVVEVEVLFGAAAKPGRIVLAVPATGRAQPRPPDPPPRDSAEGRAAAAWQRAIGDAVEGAEVALGTVLGRVRLNLSDLAALAPGDRIALPLSTLAAVRLTGPGGVTVAAGRLGQTGGLRALRLGPLGAPAADQAATGEIIAAGTLRGGRAAAGPRFGSPDAASFSPAASAPERPGAAAPLPPQPPRGALPSREGDTAAFAADFPGRAGDPGASARDAFGGAGGGALDPFGTGAEAG